MSNLIVSAIDEEEKEALRIWDGEEENPEAGEGTPITPAEPEKTQEEAEEDVLLAAAYGGGGFRAEARGIAAGLAPTAPARETPLRWEGIYSTVLDHVKFAMRDSQRGVAGTTLAPLVAAEDLVNAALDGLSITDMAARAGQGIGFDVDSEFFELNIFGHMLKTIHDGTGQIIERDPKTVTEMVVSGAAMMLPESMGAGKAGQATKEFLDFITTRGGKIASTLGWFTKAAPSVANAGAHLTGVTAFGAAKGYSEADLYDHNKIEGTFESAQQWAMIDTLLMPLRGMSRTTQAAVGGPLMYAYAKLMADETDDPKAVERHAMSSLLLGWIFPFVSKSNKLTPKHDLARIVEPVQNWIAQQKRLNVKLEPGSYIEQYYDVLLQEYGRSAMVPGESELLTRRFQKLVRDRTGEETFATGLELEQEMIGAMETAPGASSVTHKQRAQVAHELVEAARIFDTVTRKELYHDLDETPANDHSDAVKLELYEKRRNKVIDLQKRIVAQGEVPFKRKVMSKIHQIKGTTFAPESKYFADLILQNPHEFRIMRDQFNMRYASSNKSSHFSNLLEKEVGYEKMSTNEKEWFRTLKRSQVDLDIIGRLQPGQLAMFYTDKSTARGAQLWVEDAMKKHYGTEFNNEWEAMQGKLSAYDRHNEATLSRARDSGVISEEAYQAYKDYHYATSKTFEELAQEADFFKQGLFEPSLNVQKPVHYFKVREGQMLSDDVMYLSHRFISRMERVIDNSAFYEGGYQMAINHPENTLFMTPSFKYERMIWDKKLGEGRWSTISKVEYEEIQTNRKKLQAEKAELKELQKAKNVEIFDEVDTSGLASNKEMIALKSKKTKMRKELDGLNSKLKKLEKDLELTHDEKISKVLNKKIAVKRVTGADPKTLAAARYEVMELQKEITLTHEINFELLTERNGQRARKTDVPNDVKGWKPVKYWQQSVPKYVMIREEVAPYMDLRGEIGQRVRTGIAGTTVRYLLGTPVIKLMSVAFEPFFGIGTAPRDVHFFGNTDPNVKLEGLTKTASVTHYASYVVKAYPKLIADITGQKGLFAEAAEVGLMHGSSTLAGITQATITGRGVFYEAEFIRKPKGKFAKRRDAALNAITATGVVLETASRLGHYKYLTEVKGWGKKDAAMQVNQLMNYMRKGAGMEGLDSVLAFFNATSQALSGHARAGFGKEVTADFVDGKVVAEHVNEAGASFSAKIPGTSAEARFNKTYGLKMAEFGLARGLLLGLGMALNKDQMLGQSVSSRVNYITIPAWWQGVKNKDGQLANFEFRIKLDNTPIESLVSILINRMYDATMNNLSPERDELYRKEWLKSLNAYRIVQPPAVVKAAQALFNNIDPMDARALFSQADKYLPMDQMKASTNRAAIVGARFLNMFPGLHGEVGPAGVGGLMQAYGAASNSVVNLPGAFTHKLSDRASNSTAYAMYEVFKPAFNKTFFRYSNQDQHSEEDRLFKAKHNSPVYKLVYGRANELATKFAAGGITVEEAFSSMQKIDPDTGITQLHMKMGLEYLKRRVVLESKWDAIEQEHPEGVMRMPNRSRIQSAATWAPSAKIQWYEEQLEKLEDDGEAVMAFNKVSKILGLTSKAALSFGGITK